MNPIILTTGEIRFDTFLEKSVQLPTIPVGEVTWERVRLQRCEPATRVDTAVANLNDGPFCRDTLVMI